jgi:hypothetical protein
VRYTPPQGDDLRAEEVRDILRFERALEPETLSGGAAKLGDERKKLAAFNMLGDG